MTMLLLPTVVFTVMVVLNTMVNLSDDAVAVPIMDILIVLLMWILLSFPAVFAGATLSSRTNKLTFPTHTSSFAREIPPIPWYKGKLSAILWGGLVSFSTFFVNFNAILDSVWYGQIYATFGFAMLVFLLVCTVTGVSTAALVFQRFLSEDHQWWWPAFSIGGASGGYMFLYSVYWFLGLEVSPDTPLMYGLYFGYMTLLSLAATVTFGSIGVLSSLWFNRMIYGKVEVNT